jgi:hypothetical protein
MSKPAWLGAALAGSLAVITVAASAHEIVGNRFFPATLAIDDPGVNDELAFPTIARSKSPTTPDSAAFRQLDVSAEFSKRITDLEQALRAGRSHDGWRQRFPKSGNRVQVPIVQKRRA